MTEGEKMANGKSTMENGKWFLPGLCLLVAVTAVIHSQRASAQTPQGEPVTLYSPNKYPGFPKRTCIEFQSPQKTTEPCDLYYGYLYAGDDWDWLQSSTATGNRSVIKDLGAREWTNLARFDPVEPLPVLKPGEQRRVMIDVSGKDGEDGKPGAPARPGAPAQPISPGFDVNAIWDPGPNILQPRPSQPQQVKPAAQPKPKNDGVPKIDPLFVKAVVGHMYVIHIVDETRDFYALFRVEALERGDYCTVSWRLVPQPRTLEKIKK
jgi:hypothetical protein